MNGRLGHGDESDQKLPKIVMQMVGKHVKQVACGGSHSACTILHGWVPDDEVQLCMSCKSPFTFYKRKVCSFQSNRNHNNNNNNNNNINNNLNNNE